MSVKTINFNRPVAEQLPAGCGDTLRITFADQPAPLDQKSLRVALESLLEYLEWLPYARQGVDHGRVCPSCRMRTGCIPDCSRLRHLQTLRDAIAALESK